MGAHVHRTGHFVRFRDGANLPDAMGHRFEDESLRCRWTGCRRSWFEHRQDPQPCEGAAHRTPEKNQRKTEG